MSLRHRVAAFLFEVALELTDDIQSEATAKADYNKAISTVQSILQYIKTDADKYDDITPAVLEFSLLNEQEKEISFFYLLGQVMGVIGDGQ